MLTALSVCWLYCYSLVYACLAISASANINLNTHYRRHNISTEKVFYFQSDRQGFLFSNSPRARQSFPDLKSLNINEHVCFQFSPDYTDEMDRYILTGFKKQAN